MPLVSSPDRREYRCPRLFIAVDNGAFSAKSLVMLLMNFDDKMIIFISTNYTSRQHSICEIYLISRLVPLMA